MAVAEGLQACRFCNREAPELTGVVMDEGASVFADVAGDGRCRFPSDVHAKQALDDRALDVVGFDVGVGAHVEVRCSGVRDRAEPTKGPLPSRPEGKFERNSWR
jgi:hypothetical protein